MRKALVPRHPLLPPRLDISVFPFSLSLSLSLSLFPSDSPGRPLPSFSVGLLSRANQSCLAAMQSEREKETGRGRERIPIGWPRGERGGRRTHHRLPTSGKLNQAKRCLTRWGYTRPRHLLFSSTSTLLSLSFSLFGPRTFPSPLSPLLLLLPTSSDHPRKTYLSHPRTSAVAVRCRASVLLKRYQLDDDD